MDVEPCYPLLSAELESAEALASSQHKFQTLYSNGPHHGNVQSLTEDWKVGPFGPSGVGLIPLGVLMFLQVLIFPLIPVSYEENESDALYPRKITM